MESAPPYPLTVAIRVVLADDHYLVREGVRSVLEAEPELEVAAVCEDLDSLLGAVDAERPDVVVTDIRMPPGNTDEGIRAAERLRETHPAERSPGCQHPDPQGVLHGVEGRSRAIVALQLDRQREDEAAATLRERASREHGSTERKPLPWVAIKLPPRRRSEEGSPVRVRKRA
jgi:CheY-like chemotaxis protein